MKNDVKHLSLQQFVKKRSEKNEIWLRAKIVLSCLAFFAFFYLLVFLHPFLRFGGGISVLIITLCIGFYLFSCARHEYEYAYTDGMLTVDEVKGRKAKKRAVSADVENILEFGEFKEGYAEQTRHDIFLNLASDDVSEKKYYATYRNEESQIVMFLFSPDERFLEVFEKLYRRQY